eukprot:CAMPEP_0181201994 /NCGR_PEP_ID=MMETSP1096-20121128/18603_1 /TAXON_ID=156174 ORGANISM="Chrysochromulina ericina, Strain CCMP281" /NCGR_SAMPLE_ID=MMETSP1096 /ASSEMBLY_ACC=CAM_ASM_000453 /LENGTH=150 /DNA_ID=CAMNT_0023292473 /DNA_START=283 /DNA_END=736 /DNA_ORIENTATION=+
MCRQSTETSVLLSRTPTAVLVHPDHKYVLQHLASSIELQAFDGSWHAQLGLCTERCFLHTLAFIPPNAILTTVGADAEVELLPRICFAAAIEGSELVEVLLKIEAQARVDIVAKTHRAGFKLPPLLEKCDAAILLCQLPPIKVDTACATR